MKILDLWERLARFPPHHFLVVEFDGIDAESFTIEQRGGGVVVIEATPPGDYTALPTVATDAMLAAAEKQLHLPRNLAANAWRVMREASLEE